MAKSKSFSRKLIADSKDADKVNPASTSSHQPIRTILSKAQVLEIFRLKARSSPKGTRLCSAITSATVAKWYGVCSKTVRDIWMGRTWYRATHPLEPGRVDSKERLSKQPGRPRGAKDSRPRTRRNFLVSSFSKSCFHLSCSWNEFNKTAVDSIDYDSLLNFLDNDNIQEFVDPFHDDWPHW